MGQLLLVLPLLMQSLLGTGAQAQAARLPAVETQNQMDAAQNLMQEREFAKALDLLRPIMREAAPPPDLFILMATCHLNLNETSKALELFEHGMSLYPGEPLLEEFYVKLLTNYVPLEQMGERLRKALAASPRSLVLLRASAFVEVRRDPRSDQARDLVNRLVEIAPENPNSHYVYGQWARLNHQEELAVREWEKTLSLTRADAQMEMDVYTLIGDAEHRLNRTDRAEAAFKKALAANARLENHNPASAFFYAEFLAKQGRFDESDAVIGEILGWAPSYGPALLQHALHLARSDRQDEAIAAAERALSGTDLNPEQTRGAHVLLAKTYFRLKRLPDAEKHQQWLQSH